MYNETQLAALKLFGDKTLSDGCIIKALMLGIEQYFTCIGMRKITDGVGIYQYDKFEMDGVPMEILGHEPHLENFCKYIMGSGVNEILISTEGHSIVLKDKQTMDVTLEIPYDLTLPLLLQPTLSEIVNLFSK